MNYPQGAVYTKQWVVDLMLDLSGYSSSKDLLGIRVLEPSCGSGAFLIPIVRRLCSSIKGRGIAANLLADCIRAVDINENSICVCRKKVAKVLSSEGFSQEDSEKLAATWILGTDFLSGSFPGFDLVIGNPPYISSDDLSEIERKQYRSNLSTVTMGTDLFVGFIEKGLRCLSPNGRLCFICADRWMQNAYGKKLRQFITCNYSMEVICRMHGVSAFEHEVSAYPAITMISSDYVEKCKYIVCAEDFDSDDASSLRLHISDTDYSDRNYILTNVHVQGESSWTLSDPGNLSIIEYMRTHYPSIEDTGVRIGIGIATGRDRVFITSYDNLVERGRMTPLILKEDIRNGELPEEPLHWLINPWQENG